MPETNAPPRFVAVYVRRSSAAAANPLAQAIQCLRALFAAACDTVVIFYHQSK